MPEILSKLFGFVCEFFSVGIVVFSQEIVNCDFLLEQFVVQGGTVVVTQDDIGESDLFDPQQLLADEVVEFFGDVGKGEGSTDECCFKRRRS